MQIPFVISANKYHHVQFFSHYERSDNERYLQKSKVPTMHFQPSLPRLPIPPLEATCQRYLNAQLPLLDSNAMENTKKLVSNFQAEAGAGTLHQHILLLYERLKDLFHLIQN